MAEKTTLQDLQQLRAELVGSNLWGVSVLDRAIAETHQPAVWDDFLVLLRWISEQEEQEGDDGWELSAKLSTITHRAHECLRRHNLLPQ